MLFTFITHNLISELICFVLFVCMDYFGCYQRKRRKRKATLEASRADASKSGVSMQRIANTPTTSTPCVSLHRPRAPGTRSSQMSFTPAPGNPGPWMQQWKMRSRPRSTTSPLRSSISPPVTASLLYVRRNMTL